MTPTEAEELCKDLCDRIWKTNLGSLFDKVVLADSRGLVSDTLYAQLLDFFYYFIPMIVGAPRSDPVIVRAGDLQSHRRIMNMFGPGRGVEGRGTHNKHKWFSRPRSQGVAGLLEELGRGLGVLM
jgi:hypothetical protein